MKSINHSTLLILALFYTSLAFVHNSLAEEKMPVPVQGKFRIFPIDLNLSNINYMIGEKDIPVAISANTTSPFYKMPTNSVIDFYSIENGPDGKPQRIPVAQGNLSSAGPLPLLIFSKITGNDKKVRVDPVKDDLLSFPLGSFLAINRSASSLLVQMNSKAVTVAPNSITILAPPALDPGGRTILFQIYSIAGSSKVLLYSNNWAFSTAVRTMLIINPAVPPATQPVISRIGEGMSSLMEVPDKTSIPH